MAMVAWEEEGKGVRGLSASWMGSGRSSGWLGLEIREREDHMGWWWLLKKVRRRDRARSFHSFLFSLS